MAATDRDAAYEALPPAAATLYRRLGLSPAAWNDAELLAVLANLEPSAVEDLAAMLLDAGLIETRDDGFALSPHGHLHALIKAEDCEPPEHEQNKAGLDRLCALLTNAAGTAERLITPSHRALWDRDGPAENPAEAPFRPEEAAALDWLERHLPIYMDVIRFAVADQRHRLACDLVHSLWPLWLRRRHPDQCLEALTLGLAAAELTRDQNAIGLMLTTLATTIRATSPVAAYRYGRRAAGHYEQIGDTKGLAQALNGLGKSLLDAGQFDRAEEHFHDAEQLRGGLGYLRGAALSRQGRGLVALARGDARTAAELLLSAHQVLLGLGDLYDAGLTLAHHAEAVGLLGDLDAALVDLGVAATAMRQASSVFGQALVWEIRARILTGAGRGEQAQTAYTQAISLFEQVDPSQAKRIHALTAAG